eukprot:CAMPEP_0194393894 /NCGR_PEP_ID=MMETSP0174-20130528/123548_1 /TAXON_ID=216777 /ORGANISM="Proboscia alata, Strain PI-D3" /LENGTH=287 /DNA_ID=CAMNT_0039189621 /DNA_START=367 /DNA_END=1231 /DNA_ORIENTATION=-
MLELVETLMGEDAGEEQLLYLRETKKPSELKVQSWIRRMKAINAYLPSLGETALTELELVRIITQRIPRAWRTQFKLSEGHKAKTSIAAQRKLCLIESEEKEKRDLKERGNRDLNDTRRPRGKNNQKKLDSDGFIFKNKCTRCKDDEHDWYDCPIYNEKSKAYKARKKLEEKSQDRGKKDLRNVTSVKQEYLIESEKKEKGNRDLKDENRSRGKNDQKNFDSDGFIFKNKCTRCKDDEHDWYDCPIYNEKSKAYKARKKLEEKSQDREHNYMSDDSDDREIEDRDDF